MKLAAAAAVLLAALAPTLLLLGLSLGDPAYRELLAEGRQLALFWRSLWISSLATGLALLFGSVVALGARSLRGAASAALETAALVPLLLPSVASVMGWVYLTGPSGALRGSVDLYRPAWAAVVLACCHFPLVTVSLLAASRTLDPSLAEAARLCAGPWRAALRVRLPLCAPYLSTALLLVFLLSFADYAVPWALGVNVYPVEIHVQMSAYFDVARAVAYCAPPAALSLALVALRGLLVPAGHGAGARGRPARAARSSRLWLAPAALVLAMAALLPLAELARTAGSLSSAREAAGIAGHNALRSLAVALGAALALVLGGAVLALALAPRGRAARAAASCALLLPLAIPGAAVGLGIVLLDARGLLPRPFTQSSAVLSYAAFCRFLGFPALLLATAFAELRPRLLQAAELAGAGAARAFSRVALPLAAPGLFAAALVSFLLAMGELSASALAAPPGAQTLALRIASLLHFGEDRVVAALCLSLAALVLGPLLLGLLVLNRRLTLPLDADRGR